jgi:hypothetical protein
MEEFGVLMAKECSHTWYMREPGIQCTKCLIIWDDTDTLTFLKEFDTIKS